MNKSYNLFTDPGHGWLEVPISELKELGLMKKISVYSYKKNDMAYLEEDCDAGLFVQAYKVKYGMTPDYIEQHTNADSPVRKYRSFK